MQKMMTRIVYDGFQFHQLQLQALGDIPEWMFIFLLLPCLHADKYLPIRKPDRLVVSIRGEV